MTVLKHKGIHSETIRCALERRSGSCYFRNIRISREKKPV